jgi:hypothetical protein
MQQLSGSSGRGGIHTPAIKLLLRCISDFRSWGDESREEKTIAGLEPELSSDLLVDMAGCG